MGENYSTVLPEPEAEEVEQFREEKGITKSEAVKRLVQSGVEHRSNASDRTAELAGSLGWASLSLSFAGLAVGFTTPAGAAALLAAVLFVASAVARWRGGR
jgi:hypothetical protein